MARSKRGRTWWMTPVDREVIERRLRAGEKPRVIAADFGCHERTVQRLRADLFMRRRVSDSGFRLGFEERIEIAIRVARGESNAQIARVLGRHRSTIGRELARCQSRSRYRPMPAQRRADRLARRPKPTRLVSNPGLLAAVEEGLVAGWSPQQIAVRLRREYPDDVGMRVSHETIYQSLYVQSRGELRRELTAQLRTEAHAPQASGPAGGARPDHRHGDDR